MRRFLILLLILLLPLQVIAGAVSDRFGNRIGHSHGSPHPLASMQTNDPVKAADTANKPFGDLSAQHRNVADAPSDQTAEDLVNHIAFCDDAMPAGYLIFAAYSPAFVSGLHNDAALPPPYLPPATRPPRV